MSILFQFLSVVFLLMGLILFISSASTFDGDIFIIGIILLFFCIFICFLFAILSRCAADGIFTFDYFCEQAVDFFFSPSSGQHNSCCCCNCGGVIVWISF